MHPISPLAPERFPDLPEIPGVRLAAGATGTRYKGREDLMLAELAPGTTMAGVFTKSQTASPPVEWCRKQVKRGRARAIVVNAGNANTFTGRDGHAAVAAEAAATAKLVGCAPQDVFIASTGVIGVKLPVAQLIATLPGMHKVLSASAWKPAAAAIMTTDTFAKGATRQASIGGVKVTINGFCKGSGMIAPDMATMLCFVFTDAKLPAPVLQKLLNSAVERSFNCITVDGDTSTSDTVLLAATGQAKHKRIANAADAALKDFRTQLDALILDLAHQVVRDGEGAQKFVTINVSGAVSSKAARKIGLTIGNSPLVKTAIAAGDANWGRIVAAVGRAGEKANRDKLVIKIGGVPITYKGEVVPGYDEAPVARHMQGRDIVIDVDVGVGRAKATVWTCDLTHAYIDINGSYRS
ncbi:MAG TPA: bifunctional glutamate N-acetyltransferase/amino-acid acetyltransferase ArgJ [Alphaproteobacteria bacterium]|nr:bifunctional glutamate N-acetyltransferase/amino-acid acetyltransferase ArgJ [Alphaproteobacteria bacterium]